MTSSLAKSKQITDAHF